MIPTLPKLPITPKELDDEVATTTFGPLEEYAVPDVIIGRTPDQVFIDELQPAPVPPQRKMHKVPRSQLTALKKKLIIQQKGRCPLSEKRFDPAKLQDAVVDHDHTTGEIRGVLSRSANAVEGKVKNAVARWGGTGENYPAIIAYLKRLVVYLEKQGTGLIYPLHKTDDEKRLDRNKAAREARAKRMAQQKLKERK